MDGIAQELTNETLAKKHLEKWLDTKRETSKKGVDILVKEYPVFKLKKKKIKNKKYNLIKNTKVYFFLFKDCIPTSVSFSNLENCNPRENGYKYTVGITYSLDGDFGPKRDAAL